MPSQQGKTQPNPDGIARATFKPADRSVAVPVHFNPESLTLTFSNGLSSRGTNDKSSGETGPAAAQQQANTFAATLSMKLLFDTTHSGQNVRQDTIEFQRMLRPTGKSGLVPQVVLFEWGSFRFSGTFATYTETIDYFSATGIPLRASVDISMVENQDLTSTATGATDVADRLGGFGGIEIGARAGVSLSATLGGDAFSARAIAELNGEASVRRLSGAPLTLDAEVELQGAVAFATGSVSLGLNVGGGLGIELGASAGGNAGFGAPGAGADGSGLDGAATALGASAAGAGSPANAGAGPGVGSLAFGAGSPSSPRVLGSSAASAASTSGNLAGSPAGGGLAVTGSASSAARASATARAFAGFVAAPAAAGGSSVAELSGPVWGSRASAGVPAVHGAFAGLQKPTRSPRLRRRLDAERLLARGADERIHTDADALFEVGGRAVSSQGSGLKADVGTNASLNDRIRFDAE